jgi:transposase
MKNQTRKLIRRGPRNGHGAPVIASKNCNVRLYEEDLDEVLRMVNSRGSNESEIVREIVNDWMRFARKKAVAAEAATSPERLRDLVSKEIAQHVEPLREKQDSMKAGVAELLATLAEVKESIQGEIPGGDGDGHSPLLDELKGLLRRLETELVAARQYVAALRAESGKREAKQTRQLDRLLEGHQAQYTVLGQAFICGWTTLDFVVRVLVEASLREQGFAQEQIDADTTEDRVNLRTNGLQIIQSLERQLKLPPDLALKYLNPLVPAPEEA